MTGENLSMPPSPKVSSSPNCELDAAAVKLRKVYKSYRTRSNLADCVVVVGELWWKSLDFASLKHNSISFFNGKNPETAASWWTRARTRAAKRLQRTERFRSWHCSTNSKLLITGINMGTVDAWSKSESTEPFCIDVAVLVTVPTYIIYRRRRKIQEGTFT